MSSRSRERFPVMELPHSRSRTIRPNERSTIPAEQSDHPAATDRHHNYPIERSIVHSHRPRHNGIEISQLGRRDLSANSKNLTTFGPPSVLVTMPAGDARAVNPLNLACGTSFWRRANLDRPRRVLRVAGGTS